MTREQMIAWFTIEGWQPVKCGKWRGFINGTIFVHWKSDSIRSILLRNMVGQDKSIEPAHNTKRFPDRQVRRCMEHIQRMRGE